MAPLVLSRAHDGIASFGNILLRAAHSLPTDAPVTSQRVLIVNAPAVFVSAFGPVIQALEGRPYPKRYVPFPLPAIGETVRLDAVTVPFFADPS